MGNRASQPSSEPVSESFGSMWVLKVADFLELDHVPSHEDLQEKGLLVKRSPAHFCVFVSHQWLGFSHPDPEFLQLPVLQKALRKLIAGEIVATSDLASQFLGDTRRFSQQERKSLRTGYIWLDWFSIPQKTFKLDPFDLKDSPSVTPSSYSELEVGAVASALRSPTGTNQDLFISSIPFYVEVSDVFVALVPRLHHRDTGQLCYLKSYLTRGWCRLEMWCSILSPSEKPFLLVKGSNEVEFANLIFMADRPPHEGDFTIESDRPVIFYVMRKALRAKLRTLRQQRVWDLYRFILARYELLLGIPRRERDLTSFIQDFHFESLESARSIRGIGPLECAILSGHVAMIPVLAHAGYDLTRVVHAQINMQTLQEGHSSLAFALELSWRSPEVASQLVKFRANPNRTDAFGLLPLGFCQTPEAVEMLVQHRADVNKCAGPLHLPPLSNCCIRCAPAGVVAKLLEYRAEIDQKAALRGVGAAQPLAALGVFSSVNPHVLEVAQLLLDAKAFIDSQCPGRGVFHLVELLSRARIRCAPPGSRLVRFFAEWSATPLGIACYFGGHEYVDFLLQAEADPNIRNHRGNTAFQLAYGENVLKVIDQFQTISI
eukprot:s3145_g2.t1